MREKVPIRLFFQTSYRTESFSLTRLRCAQPPWPIRHYIETLHAEYIGIAHQFHFIIDEDAAARLLEVYHYEWNR